MLGFLDPIIDMVGYFFEAVKVFKRLYKLEIGPQIIDSRILGQAIGNLLEKMAVGGNQSIKGV